MDTEQALIMWRGAQHDSERMCAQLLLLAEYREVDPSHPLGGPDGIKDAVCLDSKGERWVMAVYFTRDPVDFKDIEAKFRDDAKGIAKNNAHGIVFFTNNKLTIGEREMLSSIVAGTQHEADIWHRERIRVLLDDPRGYGTRYRFLNVFMSEAEQVSFFEVYNQAVLGKLNEILQSQRAHSERLDERLASIEAMMKKLTPDQVNMNAVLPEPAAEISPRHVAPSPEAEQEEPTGTPTAPAPAFSNEEGSAS
jgi:hypothetical protein